MLAGVAISPLVACSSQVDESSRQYKSVGGVTVTLDAPRSGEVVETPLRVSGTVPSSWSFEASFPIELQDANHRKVAQGNADVKDWTSEREVGFTASIPFKSPETDAGFLVLRRDNPSGEAANADSVEVPVNFK
jgi:hypothetical protein